MAAAQSATRHVSNDVTVALPGARLMIHVKSPEPKSAEMNPAPTDRGATEES